MEREATLFVYDDDCGALVVLEKLELLERDDDDSLFGSDGT